MEEILPPQYWAMEAMDQTIGHGLFELRRGLHRPAAEPSDDKEHPQEDCTVCHRPREGYFEGVVGDFKEGKVRKCRLCDALHSIVVEITQEPYQVSHPFSLEVCKGSPAILHICVAVTFFDDVYEPVFAKYQVFFQASEYTRLFWS